MSVPFHEHRMYTVDPGSDERCCSYPGCDYRTGAAEHFGVDEINNMLDEEFHTSNGIPTDPNTHKLFYVSRVSSTIMWLLGVIGGVLTGYTVGRAQGHGSTTQVILFLLGLALILAPAHFL